jgi:hypothetical protein
MHMQLYQIGVINCFYYFRITECLNRMKLLRSSDMHVKTYQNDNGQNQELLALDAISPIWTKIRRKQTSSHIISWTIKIVS